MAAEIKMFDVAARRIVAAVANLHVVFYFTILGHPHRAVCSKIVPLIANAAIPARRCACPNKAGRSQGPVTPFAAVNYPLLQFC
jgi:hypothetical protein